MLYLCAGDKREKVDDIRRSSQSTAGCRKLNKVGSSWDSENGLPMCVGN